MAEGGYDINGWEFIDVVPTVTDVAKLLDTLDPVFGVETVEFTEYVVPLPQSKKVTVDVDGRKETRYHSVVSLYMSVAGRVKMLQAAAEKHGWRVDFEPEPHTPTGVAGFLQMDDRLVYREYAVIYEKTGRDNEQWRQLGRKPGMAWVPSKGGKQAAGSNPYEKVETAARGRAIAAWGFGVLPGSGIASLEEMHSAQTPDEPEREQKPKKSRGDLLKDVLVLAEEVRQERGIDEDAITDRMVEFLRDRLGLSGFVAFDETDGETMKRIEWQKVNDAQLALLANTLKQTLIKIRTDSTLPGADDV